MCRNNPEDTGEFLNENEKNFILPGNYYLFFTGFSYAQKEDNVWYFGRTGAGLDFSECEPTVLTNGAQSQAFEGAASICDKSTGQILFYTDGPFIYNANHVQMTGGPAALWNTVTQNTIIQKPGSSSIYYLISPEAQAACGITNLLYPKGINYAVIDMTLNSGLGGIVSAHNALIDSANCEKITALRNSNGQDIWLIGHRYNSNQFIVFNVTSAGINTVPSYYAVGPTIYTHQNNTAGISCFDAIGELKASPSGTKLAFTTFYNGYTAIFDFDNSTGIISNAIAINLGGWGGYGVSFSPNSSKLYIGCIDTSQIMGNGYNGRLFQFDISSGDSAAIQNSQTLIYNSPTNSYSSLKLGPNGKIYAALHTGSASAFGSNYLGVINYPDSSGLACQYVHQGLYLNGLSSTWGLNNIMERNNFCNDVNSITDHEEKEIRVSLSPNPASEELLLSLGNNVKSNTTLSIYNFLGAEILTAPITNTQTNINIRSLPSGVYFINVKEEGKSLGIKKFVKM